MFYYSCCGYDKKALDAFCDYFADKKEAMKTQEFSRSLYHALDSCVPAYIDLLKFLTQIMVYKINFNDRYHYLSAPVNKFVHELGKEVSPGLDSFTGDVLGGSIENYLKIHTNGSYGEKFDSLIISYTGQKFEADFNLTRRNHEDEKLILQAFADNSRSDWSVEALK